MADAEHDHALTCGVCGESFVPETPDDLAVCQSCWREAHRG